MQSTTFTIDAALLRELGERLIGRPYIALAELVKNSYDADATNCRIEFGSDSITVFDNGHGMSEQEFHDHWMRIGTTHKTAANTSKRLNRTMTGSKGLGRLSTQFLADEMTLESASEDEPSRHLCAFVDWAGITRGQNIDTFEVRWRMRPGRPGKWRTGTKVVLRNLRSPWDTEAIENLGKNVWLLRSPFRREDDHHRTDTAQDFEVTLDAPGIEHAREAFDKMQNALFENWKARIRGSLFDGRVGRSRAAVSVEFREGYPKNVKTANFFREYIGLPVVAAKPGGPAIDRAEFEILVFKPEGRQPARMSVTDMRAYLREFGNVSVYDAGFRLPYYGATHDWLDIATDQGRRLTISSLLPASLHTGERYLLDLPAPQRIFGSVKIDTSHERRVAHQHRAKPGTSLQISPGRDRLTDNAAFDQLRDLVRFSLDFYANRYCRLRLQAAEETRAKGEAPSRAYDRAISVLDDNRTEISAVAYRKVRQEIVAAKSAAAAEEDVGDRRAEMLAPLASAGMTALALNHELARESVVLDRARQAVRSAAKRTGASELLKIVNELDAAAERIDALRDLFGPLLSREDRQATDRLRVLGVVRQVVRALESLMPRVRFDVARVPESLRFPIGSFAEWSALLQNLLTNAWNAMLETDGSSVSFEGGRGARRREWLRVSDTGVGLGIPLEESDELFEPFERRLRISAENRSIAMGGQGLGLAIVRMIARHRSARAAFVRPEGGFSTTIEISWKGAQE